MILSERVRNDIKFAYLCALACWCLTSYSLLIDMLGTGELFACAKDNRPCISDWVVIYSGAVLAAKSRLTHVNIYDSDALSHIANELVAPIVSELPMSLQYPPYFFILIEPLASFGLKIAWLIWSIASLSLLAFSLRWLTTSRFSKPRYAFFVALATLASFPCWLGLKIGQTCFLLLFGQVVFWSLLRSGKFFQAGLAMALCLFKLQYAPFLVLVGLLVGKIRYLLGLCLASVLLLIGSLLGVGLTNTQNYAAILTNGEMRRVIAGVDSMVMQNFRGELNLFFGADSDNVHAIALALAGASIAMLAILWWRSGSQVLRKDSFDRLAAITVLVMLIASPHTHAQDYLICVMPFVWLWPRAIASVRWLILLFPLLSWILFLTLPIWLAVKIEPFFLVGLTLIFYAVCTQPKDESTAAAKEADTAG